MKKKQKTDNNSFLVKSILLLILLAATFLRLWRLDKIPPGFTPDEAAQGYTAYSILKTGRDEWGVKFPLNPRSFGDFKPPLQTYLMIPSVAIFGLNEFAVRLPNALLGSLAVLGIFLLATEIFATAEISLLAAALLAFSPWHLPLSRGAFEANLTVFFTSFGVYFLFKMFKEKCWCWQILAALFLGLNLFSYHSAKLITPLLVIIFFLALGTDLLQKGENNKKVNKNSRLSQFIGRNWQFLTIFCFFLILAFASFFRGGQKRGLDVAIFHPTDNWRAVKDARWFAVHHGLSNMEARLFHNKFTYSIAVFSRNYISYFSPQFLFSEGPGEGTYGMIPGHGVLWWWELPVLLWFFFWLAKKPDKRVILLLFLVMIAPIPAALAKGNRAANRAATMMPWIQILIAAGLRQLIKQTVKLRQQSSFQGVSYLKIVFRSGLIFSGLVISYLLASFFEDYFIQSARKIAPAMLYGRCQALRWAAKHYSQTPIIISRKLSEPQAYVLFCLKYPPGKVQKETKEWLGYREKRLGFVDQLGEYRLGRFIFKEINWPSDKLVPGATLVGLPGEFPSVVEAEKTILYPDGQRAIVIAKGTMKTAGE